MSAETLLNLLVILIVCSEASMIMVRGQILSMVLKIRGHHTKGHLKSSRMIQKFQLRSTFQ